MLKRKKEGLQWEGFAEMPEKDDFRPGFGFGQRSFDQVSATAEPGTWFRHAHAAEEHSTALISFQ